MHELDEISSLIAAGQTEKAIERLHAWLKTHAPDEIDYCNQISGNFQTAKTAQLQNRIPFQEFSRTESQTNFAIQEKVKQHQNRLSKSQKRREYPQAFTCDRFDQTDAFGKLRDAFLPGKAYFFHIFGEELQAPDSLFKRFAADHEGRLFDLAAAAGRPPHRRVLPVGFVAEGSRDQGEFCRNFIRDLFKRFGVEPDDRRHWPLLEKNLCYLLEHSDLVRGRLTEEDFIFVFAHISYFNWHRTLTPELARWFARDFCKHELPANCPPVLFFFSFDYDELMKPGVREQVVEAVQASEHFTPLPELNMVIRDDVGQWLARNHAVVPDVRERRRILLERFPGTEHYMADVEPVLEELIDNYFNTITRM